MNAFAFFLLLITIYLYPNSDYTDFDWNNIIMHAQLPIPSSTYGDIQTNDEENLSIELTKMSFNDFNKYIEECKKKGYTYETEQTDTSFSAENKAGYHLTLEFQTLSDETSMYIELTAPIGFFEKIKDKILGQH